MLKKIAPVMVGLITVSLFYGLLGWYTLHPLPTFLFELTGEEEPLPQLSGFIQYLHTRLQPPLNLANDVPIQYADVNPFGVNTFLQNEAEQRKQAEALRLIADAGITWIRQEFTWEDIEIHGKGDFQDRRTEPHKSAWQKYDYIVEQAEQNNIKIMARLSNPPRWTRALTDTIGAFAPPDNLEDYGDFVEAVATRYQGRIAAYQIWNEPNIYPEWGEYPVDATEYAALLKMGYERVKQADRDAIVVMGALAATIELDRQRRYTHGIPTSPGGLSDVLFLQQLYDAGAAPYFDVLAMQGYGLWSGPTDRRMQPRVLNFSRPLYVRDVMVRNGDAHKPIWLSELGWNALPPDAGLPPVYGQVSLEQQARYTVRAYQRMQEEWPWLGVGFYWFFKQADEREKGVHPQYYFRMLEPDFTPLPVYDALKQLTAQPPIVYPGVHAPSHWAISAEGKWTAIADRAVVIKKLPPAYEGELGATMSFAINGAGLSLVGKGGGEVAVVVAGYPPQTVQLNESPQLVIDGLAAGRNHAVTLTVAGPSAQISRIIVQPHQVGVVTVVGWLLIGLVVYGLSWVGWLYYVEEVRGDSGNT